MTTGNPGVARLGRAAWAQDYDATEPSDPPTADSRVVAADRGAVVDFYVYGRLVAVAMAPGLHRADYEWTACDCEGRTVGVFSREQAVARARQYAEQWAARNFPARQR